MRKQNNVLLVIHSTLLAFVLLLEKDDFEKCNDLGDFIELSKFWLDIQNGRVFCLAFRTQKWIATASLIFAWLW